MLRALKGDFWQFVPFVIGFVLKLSMHHAIFFEISLAHRQNLK